MKVLKVIGLGLIVASLSACSASVSVEEDAAAAGGGSGGAGLSIEGLDGLTLGTACEQGQDGPPVVKTIHFDGEIVTTNELIFFAADCDSIMASPDLIAISTYLLSDVSSANGNHLVTVTHGGTYVLPNTASGVSGANDLNTVGMGNGSVCDLTDWELSTPKDVSGLTDSAGPCWNAPAIGATQYGRFSYSNGELTVYEWASAAENVSQIAGTYVSQ